MSRIITDAQLYLHVKDGYLILTVPPDRLALCPECPDVHVRVLAGVSPARVRGLAEGLLQLAAQLEPEPDSRVVM